MDQGGVGRGLLRQVLRRDHDRQALDLPAGAAVHGIAGPEQQACARFRQPGGAVDAFLAQALHRQPEHRLIHLLALQPQRAAPLQMQDAESTNRASRHPRPEASLTGEPLTAVMSQVLAHGRLPGSEIVGVEHRAQALAAGGSRGWGIAASQGGQSGQRVFGRHP